MQYVSKKKKDNQIEACPVDEDLSIPEEEQPKVVVVGAGIAGLSAAEKLVQAGLTCVTIVEAIDRPGGRIHSCWLNETVAEMGAKYIEGCCVNNPVFTLASQEGLLQYPLYRREPTDSLGLTSEGQDVSVIVTGTAHHSFELINEQAAELYGVIDQGIKYGALSSFFETRITQELSSFPEDKRNEAAQILNGMTNDIRNRFGADLSKMSTAQYGSYVELPGKHIGIREGMIGILAPLIRGMTSCDSILYCKPVKSILWGKGESAQSPRVRVVCCDGDVLPADYVVVTLPLGVLKATAHEMFQPALPKDKKEAINNLSFGHRNNIYFEYEKPFWLWPEGTYRLGWHPKDLHTRDEWIKAIGLVEDVQTSQQALTVTVADMEAMCIENIPDYQLAEDFTRLIRRFTGDPTLPYPVNVMKSKWTGSQYFRGAGSYIGLKGSPNDQCALADTVPDECGTDPPKLFFAGEATISGYFNTLHGARLSGIREAEKILKAIKRSRETAVGRVCEEKAARS